MGSLLTNPNSVPVSVTADWQPLLARDSAGNFGLNMVTLTNWDTSTTAPQVAAGSKIDIMGSIASFPSDEAIGGAAADGWVWLVFVVAGSSVTAQWTNMEPDWDSGKGQWASGTNVYSGHKAYKVGTLFHAKERYPNNESGKRTIFQYRLSGTVQGGSNYFPVPVPFRNKIVNLSVVIRSNVSGNTGKWVAPGDGGDLPKILYWDESGNLGTNSIYVTITDSANYIGGDISAIIYYTDQK